MTRRDHLALEATTMQLDLPTLAAYLDEAIKEVPEAPEQDPAVILLGSFVAFHVHADMNSALGYHRLVSACEERIASRSIQ